VSYIGSSLEPSIRLWVTMRFDCSPVAEKRPSSSNPSAPSVVPSCIDPASTEELGSGARRGAQDLLDLVGEHLTSSKNRGSMREIEARSSPCIYWNRLTEADGILQR
jgi:hypothetical protein